MEDIAKNYSDSIDKSDKRSYDAMRSKKSYHLNRIKVYRRRILNAIAKGRCVLERTIRDPKYNWNDAEKSMLQRCLDLRRNRYIVPSEQITVIKDKRYLRAARDLAIMETIKQKLVGVLTNGDDDNSDALRSFLRADLLPYINQNIKLYNIRNDVPRPPSRNTVQPFGHRESNSDEASTDTSSVSAPNNAIVTFQNDRRGDRNTSSSDDGSSGSPSPTNVGSFAIAPPNVGISAEDVVQAYAYMIDTDLLYQNRNKSHKAQGKRKYKNTINRMFQRFGDHSPNFNNNLMHVYKNPKVYAALTENYSDALRILFRLHLMSRQNKLPASKVSESVFKLGRLVPTTEFYSRQYAIVQQRAKERQQHNRKNAPYYDWEEIQKVFGLVKGNSITALRDRVIISIYVKENVVRDNLGLVYFIDNGETVRQNSVIDDHIANQVDYIYRRRNGTYKLVLNTYKNEAFRGDFTIKVSEETSKLVDVYIDAMRRAFPNRAVKYLITKNDGEPYKNGKLSDYIIRMFKKYTLNKAINLGINELRHSVATFYRNESLEFKSNLAYRMQHSLTTHRFYERVSNRVIKLFNENTATRNDDSNHPFLGRSIKLLVNKRLVEGVIRSTAQVDKYDVVFSDESIDSKTMDSSVIALLLENQDVSLNIGRRVRMLVSDDEITLYGARVVTGIIDLNPYYSWDDDMEMPPYIFVFDNDELNNFEKKLEFDLPHPRIELV